MTIRHGTDGGSSSGDPLPSNEASPLRGTAPAPTSIDDAADVTRFTKTVLVEGLDEPMQVEFDRQGRVYWIERSGSLKRLDETTGLVATLGTLDVDTEAEAGLIGFLLDREFETTRHIYIYYSAAVEPREMRLSRFTLAADDRLDPDSEVVVLRWGWEPASHMGGGMVWDARGNLYLSTGDDCLATQYAPIRWTNPGGQAQDAQRTAANTNDLRGKILRIKPQPDGSYTIPEGNLFAPGTPGTRPEIYIMGNRNPWRLSIDSRTGHLHWGEIGPDAGIDSAGIGPRGYDEFNVARSAGNFGWPYFIGYNRAYHRFDRDTGSYGPPFDPERPVNRSPNNTGLRELPPAQPALIAYPYAVSEEYPLLASGGRNAVGGPIYHRADFKPGAARLFPEYYEGKWFVVDFVRNWIMVVTMDEESTRVLSIERFLPDIPYSSPLDMDFGPEGDLYVVEYGTQWGQFNADARISRIEYNAGNRAPIAMAAADHVAGAVPLRVSLSSAGTVDYDGDALGYEWVVTPQSGGESRRFSDANPTLTLGEPGVYRAVLTVSDSSGESGTAELEIVAGNEPPSVQLEILQGNRSFYFPGQVVEYAVRVSDREDGRLESGIAADDVHVTVEYVPSGMTPDEVTHAGDVSPDVSMRHVRALRIMEGSDCGVCHTVDAPSAGPAFKAIAERYEGQDGAQEYLSRKIIAGGSGVWGETPMPAHPALTPAEAMVLARYVLSLAEDEAGPRRIPPRGRYVTEGRMVPADDAQQAVNERGAYVFRAAYTDKGAHAVAPISDRDAALLRYPFLAPETADVISEGITYTPSRDPGFIIGQDGAHVGFEGIDLSGISRIDIHALTRFYTWSHFVGGTVEVRLDAPTGPIVGAPVAKTLPPDSVGIPLGGDAAVGTPMFLRGEPPVSVDVSGASGIHDVYLVFRNPGATAEQALMILTGVEFRRAEPASDSSSRSGGIPEGFTPLFNGVDLTGWHVSRTSHQGTIGNFYVEDGAIVLKQGPYGQGGLLLTDETYRDFELYLEAKPDWGTNGGIFFRSTEGGSAYQIEMVGGGARGTGNLIGEMLRVSRGARAERIQEVWKEDDWNALRLRVTGEVPRVTLWVNGVQMYDVTAARNDLIADATEGMIALQVHWSATHTPVSDAFPMHASWKPGAAHRYRNIAIRKLQVSSRR